MQKKHPFPVFRVIFSVLFEWFFKVSSLHEPFFNFSKCSEIQDIQNIAIGKWEEDPDVAGQAGEGSDEEDIDNVLDGTSPDELGETEVEEVPSQDDVSSSGKDVLREQPKTERSIENSTLSKTNGGMPPSGETLPPTPGQEHTGDGRTTGSRRDEAIMHNQ